MSFSRQRILDALSPYRDGLPTHPQRALGTTISEKNWSLAQYVLPPEILTLIKNGEFTISVVPTQDFCLHEHYGNVVLRRGRLVG
jgi:hypothetical protein